MAATFSSSPPAIDPLAFMSDVEQFSDGSDATYQQSGNFPWQVGWEEALGYAATFHDMLRDDRVSSITNSKSRLGAALVGHYQEIQVDENGNRLMDENGNYQLSPIMSVVWIASIPRGPKRNDLAAQDGGHQEWRSRCYYFVEKKGKGKGKGKGAKEGEYSCVDGPNDHFHAEDLAINMMLGTRKSEWGRERCWLNEGFFLVVYGIQPVVRQAVNRDGTLAVDKTGRPVYKIDQTAGHTNPSQVWPCGPNPDHRPNSKKPCCQEVLDRMGIQWRFGIIPPLPEPELPQYPPGYFGGGGEGSGGGGGGGSGQGGGHNHASGYFEPPTEFGTLPSNVDWDSVAGNYTQAAGAHVQRGIRSRAGTARINAASATHPIPGNNKRLASTLVPPCSRHPFSRREMASLRTSLRTSLTNIVLAARGPRPPDSVLPVNPAAGAPYAKVKLHQDAGTGLKATSLASAVRMREVAPIHVDTAQRTSAGVKPQAAGINGQAAAAVKGLRNQPVQPQLSAAGTGPKALPPAAPTRPHGATPSARKMLANPQGVAKDVVNPQTGGSATLRIKSQAQSRAVVPATPRTSIQVQVCRDPGSQLQAKGQGTVRSQGTIGSQGEVGNQRRVGAQGRVVS